MRLNGVPYLPRLKTSRLICSLLHRDLPKKVANCSRRISIDATRQSEFQPLCPRKISLVPVIYKTESPQTRFLIAPLTLLHRLRDCMTRRPTEPLAAAAIIVERRMAGVFSVSFRRGGGVTVLKVFLFIC